MKSWTKTILGIGVSCSLLGAALAGYGFATGGLSDLENSTDMVGNVNYQKVNLDSFSKIDIDSTTSDVLISKADIDKPFISYSDNKKTPVNYEVKDDTLTVKQTGTRTQLGNANIHFLSLRDIAKTGIIENSHTIVISVPQDTDLTSVKANLSSGDLDISQLSLDTATLELLAGELTLTNTILNSGTVNITSGDAEIENSNLANIAFSITTGDIDLENSQASDTTFELSMGDFSANAATFKNDNTITMTTGEVDITLASKDLKVVMTNLLGDADITSNLNQSSKNTLTIDGNVGDITVQ
ncbi:DUF4097 family beta strand repeat-containing protein [Streptococcus gallolyticus]|uniref:DUF4097 family beta strand repeat-containing protein n=1 Tax=Streptococcus gallolyticus TaxID=315405 RepID=UPI000883E13D|nr:DUF4097 family beta strand repeat-containing protein [Streptococcus gallolyticus]SDK23146.1 Putative adhesin [Streptococcus gallolyticus]SDL72915.1 Putative adhesin [Streptococcus gallolyticus]